MKFKKLHFIGLVAAIVLSASSAFAQITCVSARGLDTGTVVTVTGVVTNGAELGPIRYFQDRTGALSAYGRPIMDTILRGDSIVVTGKLKMFNNLLELDPVTTVVRVVGNRALPTPIDITPSQLVEANEAKLLRITNATFSSVGNFAGNTNYTVTVNGVTGVVRVTTGSNIVGTLIPASAVNITGVLSQYCITPKLGCTTGYQLLIRDAADITPVASLYFTAAQSVSNVSTTGFTVGWKTNRASSTVLRYGTTRALGSTFSPVQNDSVHSAALTGLSPATIYYVQAVSIAGTDTVVSVITPYVTASTSTGEMRVYFNNVVDARAAQGGAAPTAITGARAEQAIVERINAATATVDVMMYNNGSAPIVQALIAAVNRGVRVRYIADKDANNTVLAGTMPFPIIRNNIFGVDGGLMHNKTYIVDAGDPAKAWVSTGSMNCTLAQLNEDYNNMIFFQDQSLARVYTVEFEEMWGGSGAQANMAAALFGLRKLDNTPHKIFINGTLVESYFSPSDKTSDNMAAAIASANTSLQVAAHNFTYNGLGSAVKLAKDRSIAVRVIVRDSSESGSEVPFLTANGVVVKVHPITSKLFHHKYAIVDPNTTSDPQVITGSHNWSAAAETKNDENTVIVHNPRITNIFYQEFEARWCEANNLVCGLSTNNIAIEGFDATIFPNPTNNVATVDMNLEKSEDVTIMLYDFSGRMLEASVYSNLVGKVQKTLETTSLSAGNYLIVFRIGDKTTARKLQVVK